MTDINELERLNTSLNALSTENAANNARISNPTREVESALTSFLTARLNRIEDDANFVDLIRLAIKERLPEASFDQLLQLLHQASTDNNRAMEGIVPLFKNESSGRTIVDTLRDGSTETTATKLYNSTNSKDVLQSLNYLTQALSKLNTGNTISTEVETTN